MIQNRFLILLPVLIPLSATVVSAQGGQTCNITNPCPSSAPCCSSYGFCGTGEFCLGGCNPLNSHSLDSCRPNPICQSATHTFADNSRIYSNASKFDGNATEYGTLVPFALSPALYFFVPIFFSAVARFSMPSAHLQSSLPPWTRPRLAYFYAARFYSLGRESREYHEHEFLWRGARPIAHGVQRGNSTLVYALIADILLRLALIWPLVRLCADAPTAGRSPFCLFLDNSVSFGAPVKTGRWNGVVMAFITMSNIKDEIDWEFPGANTTTGQTNYFWQGNIPATTVGETENGFTDTFSNYHDYTINWQPDTLTFAVDNKTMRTVKKSDTIDSNGVAHFPSTPASIQLSLWPAGINTSAPGTIQWAGGMINWNDPDYKSAGHFYAMVSSVSVQCADPSTPQSDITSYIYGTNSSTMTPSVSFSNESVMVNGARAMGEGLAFNGLGWLVIAGVMGIVGFL
ncbi:hypothetical protein EW146_g2312 [Bondarzewia mesenterica]|uniref:GH16 domain-containing protein n=1 Tax=Bondarzewia mesenterica TaxID=1095465 RepID=A0A4S4M7A0_9AGAM|nr:hypothetical protein EW146_g2312 [Bondarzewia mesenterica]